LAETTATAMQTITNQAAQAAENTINVMHTAANGGPTVRKAGKEQITAMARTIKAAPG
jgi:hypothetical protein